jgi:serine/threonine protein kinase
MVGIIDAVRYMHARNIVHLDLKPHNVLLTDAMKPKLCDFGLS